MLPRVFYFSPQKESMSELVPAKETKAQKSERLKREKNPWAVFDEVRAFAREGRSSVVPEWASFYFKWWGIYTQGDGAGVTGGKGGEGVTSDYFMMRIGVPNGILTSHQMRVIGDLTRKHARNLADITVRQAIQLHWLTIESLPEVVDALDAIGLSPKGACGDVVRNVTGCPLAGVADDEIVDASQSLSKSLASSAAMRTSTTCPASSRSRSPAALLGAPTPRSTTLPLRLSNTMARSATPCALVAASQRTRISPSDLTPSFSPNRSCRWFRPSPRSSASSKSCVRAANAPA